MSGLGESTTARQGNFTEHGLAARPDLLLDFHDNSYLIIDGEPVTAGVYLRYRFLDGTENQKRAVRTTIETKKKPADVEFFVTWEDCASVKFHEEVAGGADIRITFKREGKDDWYWSALGKDASNRSKFSLNQATMKLAGLPDAYPPTEYHRGNILHEFGHALGLRHEHQSPALGVELRENKVIEDYKGDEADARHQVLDRAEDAINYTRFDKHSIMVYPIPSRWQKTPFYKSSKRIVSNNKLSTLDQAFIRLMYPPDLSDENVDKGLFLDAMLTAGVPNATAGKILKVFAQKEGTLVDRLRSVRGYFNVWKEGSLFLFKPNQAIMRTIDPEILRSIGNNAFVGEMTRDKLFQGIVKTIVYRSTVQYGIPSKVSLPGSSQNGMARMLGALAMHNDVGHYIRYYVDGQLSRETSSAQRDRFGDIIPALLEYIEMAESEDLLAAVPPAERVTQEELDTAQEWLTQVLSHHPPDDVPVDVQRGILTKLPGIRNILDWFSRTISETRIDVHKIPPSATDNMREALRRSPPQDIFQEVYSLCFASTFVHDVNGTQKGLQVKLLDLLESLLPQISIAAQGAPGGGWKLAWGPVVWKVTPEDGSGGPDLAWYIAYNNSVKCNDDDESRPTYVIAVAGTQARSVHTWLNSNFDVTSPVDFESWVSNLRSRSYVLTFPPVAHVDEGRAYLARGTARTVWQLLAVPAPPGAKAAGQSLLDFLKSKFQSNPSLRLITTGHSLGGALSPTLALLLVKLNVVPRNHVLTYPVAGPSPGNGAFARLFSDTFLARPANPGRQGHKVWNYNLVNTRDPVPQAWCADNRAFPRQNLQNIRNMIPGSYVKYIVSAIITSILGDLTDAQVRYVPLQSQIFSADPSRSFKDVMPQHTDAYHRYVGVTPPELRDTL